MRITNWSVHHAVTIFVLMFVLVLAGLASYNSLPREAAPDITIPYVMVTTPYLGVSPSDIETLVTNPLEEELEQLKDVREIRSTSAQGASMISIEFEPDVDIDNALQLVRERVDAAQPELPEDAEDTQVTEISFSEWPIMVINISGEIGLVQLKQVAEDLRDRLERIPGVLDVPLIGGLEREILVQADPLRLDFYRVSLGELMGAIQRENINMPAGVVELGDLNYSVRIPGEFEQVSEIENLIIREEEGTPIYVRDVADVLDGLEEPSTRSRLSGVESVSLSISRRAGENIPRIAEEVRVIVAQLEEQLGERVTFTILADHSEFIAEIILDLENNIITALILVVLVLLFFMGGVRNAFFVAIAIPMSMLVSFSVLAALGVTLNMVVLFSLILALGMLVDNAIVIVENIYRHGSMGKTRLRAAKEAVAEVAWPVIASTATTVCAFTPLMFWPGIMGEFMMYMPLTVIVVLSSSLFVALVINPVVCAVFMKMKPKTEQETDDEAAALPNNLLYRLYRVLLRFSLSHRWLVGLVVMVTFVGTFQLYGKHNAGTELFPSTTPERVYVDANLPDGTNLEASDRVVRHIERSLVDLQNVDLWVANVGGGGGDAFFGGGGNTPHRSRITVEFLEKDDRVEHPNETIATLRERLSSLIGAEINLVLEDNGPPSGAPINVEIVGHDMETMGRLVTEVTQIVRNVPHVVNLSDDFETGRPEITVTVDREAASSVGISTSEVANTVRMAVNGIEASVFREGDEEYDIVVQLPEQMRNSLEDIRRLIIRSPMGEDVRITEIADIGLERGFGSIRHVDGDRVVTVGADVEAGANAVAALSEVQSQVAEMVELPPGFEIRYTGQQEEQQESQTFLSQALLGALFLIALVLVTQFNSVFQPFIILCSVILSLLGVLWVLMARQMPFGIIMTGVGVISLVGVVVNNSIVLIDYINQLKARGMASKEAIILAGLVRFRPVMLTAITTILSLMPIVLGFSLNVTHGRLESGGNSVEMWGPMANVVVAGLAVATVLTLIVVPVIYSTYDGVRGFRKNRRERLRLVRKKSKERQQKDAGSPNEPGVAPPVAPTGVESV